MALLLRTLTLGLFRIRRSYALPRGAAVLGLRLFVPRVAVHFVQLILVRIDAIHKSFVDFVDVLALGVEVIAQDALGESLLLQTRFLLVLLLHFAI